MSIYQVNQSILSKSILPPNKRTPIHLAWAKELLSEMQRSNDILNKYIDGFTSISVYNPSTSYAKGALVKGSLDLNQKVYESQTASNLGNPLLDTNYWVEVSPNFIGSVEREAYWCSKIVFEWALNKWFGTNFVQPPGTSDIYITNNGLLLPLFYIGPGNEGSFFGPLGSTGWIGPTDAPSYYATYQYTIHVPNTLYTTLPGYTGPGTADNVIRNFADLYNTFGIDYQIVTY